MKLSEAKKELRKVGTAHATGDALRAMYAGLITLPYWGAKFDQKFYEHLQSITNESQMVEAARALMRDHSATYDIAMGEKTL